VNFEALDFNLGFKVENIIPTKGFGSISTARIAIAQHAIGRHFWQEINCFRQFVKKVPIAQG
jgi:hypothetical protein